MRDKIKVNIINRKKKKEEEKLGGTQMISINNKVKVSNKKYVTVPCAW